MKILVLFFAESNSQLGLLLGLQLTSPRGQSLTRVGLDLSSEAFSHGQLYVALSRVTKASNLHVFLGENKRKTQNEVYSEIFSP